MENDSRFYQEPTGIDPYGQVPREVEFCREDIAILNEVINQDYYAKYEHLKDASILELHKVSLRNQGLDFYKRPNTNIVSTYIKLPNESNIALTFLVGDYCLYPNNTGIYRKSIEKWNTLERGYDIRRKVAEERFIRPSDIRAIQDILYFLRK